MAWIISLLLAATFCSRFHCSRDPFDMFSGTSSRNDGRSVDTSAADTSASASLLTPPLASPSEQVSTLEHYRELHRVLTRIMWRTLRVAENRSLKADDRVRIQLTASLSLDDFRTLRTYCHTNKTLSRRVSADSVNALFSRLFESVSIVNDTSTDWQLSELTPFGVPLILILLFLVARWIGVRRILLISVPSLFITVVVLQALYRKYNERLAEKMAHMSRYREPPEQCKPAHLQSWSTWLRGLVNWRPSHDECAQYYERVLTDPWIATSLYEISLELIFEPLVTLSRLSGRAWGQFYDQLSLYFPPLFAIPVMTITFLLICLFTLWFIRSQPIYHSAPQRRRQKHLKQKPVPSLPEPQKSS